MQFLIKTPNLSPNNALIHDSVKDCQNIDQWIETVSNASDFTALTDPEYQDVWKQCWNNFLILKTGKIGALALFKKIFDQI